MTTRFATRKDVTGYTYRPHIGYRGFELRCVDVSGANSFGYRFALIAEARSIPEELHEKRWEDIYDLEHRIFATSTTLWFEHDLNALGKPGCFSAAWFADDAVEKAGREFHDAVDVFLG